MLTFWVRSSIANRKYTFHSKNYQAENRTVFLIGLVGDGIQLGPLGTSATNWPIVPAPSSYKDGAFGGMMIGKGTRSTRKKSAPVPFCPPQIPHDLTGR
jgi:hypothetical protein